MKFPTDIILHVQVKLILMMMSNYVFLFRAAISSVGWLTWNLGGKQSRRLGMMIINRRDMTIGWPYGTTMIIRDRI